MNKKKCLRIVSLLMAVLLFSVCFLTSCKDKNGSDDSTGDVIKLSEYQIVHPKSASEKVTAAAETLKKGLSVDLAVTDDSAAADESKKEILLGLTDRAETTAALEEIPAGKYGIAVRGNKIIILAREDAILGDAVQYFLNLCGNKSEIELADNYLHLSDAYPFLNIVTDGKSNYTIVSGANASESISEYVTQIRETIYNLTGVRNISMEPDTYGNANEKTKLEIVVGDTNRDVSREALSGVGADGYCIKVIGNSIVINAHSLVGVKTAVDAFIEQLKANVSADRKNIAILKQDDLTGTVDGVIAGIPVPAELGVLSGYKSLNGFEYVYEKAAESNYTAYLNALTGAGYVKHDENTIGTNKFATYKKDSTAVYVSFHAFDSTLRVIAESFTALPNTTPETVTKVTESTLTQIGLTGVGEKNGIARKNTGMGYVFTLEDGSYIIVDGGGKYGDDEVNLFNFLKENNKRTDGKIVIAAWIFTSSADEHTGVFVDFTNEKSYFEQVTLNQVVYNFAPGYEISGSDSVVSNMEACVAKYTGAKTIIAHAGQRIMAGNAEIEILFTHEMLSPYFVENAGNASTVFRIKVGGQKVLFLGDIAKVSKKSEKEAVDLLIAMYGSELASDVVQMANHGVNGGSVELYTLINPILAFCPVIEEDWNAAAATETTKLIVEWSESKLVLVKGDKTVTVELPYEMAGSLKPGETGNGLELDFGNLDWQ